MNNSSAQPNISEYKNEPQRMMTFYLQVSVSQEGHRKISYMPLFIFVLCLQLKMCIYFPVRFPDLIFAYLISGLGQ
jgi:hypothetical protein